LNGDILLLYFTYIRGLGADEDRYIRSHDGRTLTPNMVMFKVKKTGVPMLT
jgi:hypothetical protein